MFLWDLVYVNLLSLHLYFFLSFFFGSVSSVYLFALSYLFCFPLILCYLIFRCLCPNEKKRKGMDLDGWESGKDLEESEKEKPESDIVHENNLFSMKIITRAFQNLQ